MKLKDIVKQIMKESLHVLSEKNTEGLSVIDKWKITDHDFLQDMGFKPNGMYHFVMDKPEMSVCHKKGVGFILEDKSKKQKLMFPKFKQLMEYFSTYEQKFENEPYL